MATLSVGQNKQFSTISSAVSASHNGDVVAIDAGTYVNDFATIDTRITLQGVGGTARLVATEEPGNRKGILVTNTDVTIDHLEFSGAVVGDGNGAGIRYQGGDLTITNSFFHDNQNGLLANSDPNGSITIRDSEFASNGAGDGYTHNLYVGDIGRLDIANSYFHDAVVGHQIKSRADTTIIRDSRVVDGDGGTGSYSIDLPNGGHAVLTGNYIEQSAASGNPVIVAFGEEGNHHPGSQIELAGNTVVNDLGSPSVQLLWNATGATAEVHGNSVFGLSQGQYGTGPAHVSDMTVLGSRPGSAPAASPPVETPRPPVTLPEQAAQPAQDAVRDVPSSQAPEVPAAPPAEASVPAPAPVDATSDWEQAIEAAAANPPARPDDVQAPEHPESPHGHELSASQAAAVQFTLDFWADASHWAGGVNPFADHPLSFSDFVFN